jgi:predicted O-methyltransferase YrrM
MSLLDRLRRAPRPRTGGPARSRVFEDDPHGRFWWHHMPGTGYVPPLYGQLSDEEWALMEAWYAETASGAAEINVPAMSVLQGLVMGSAITRIVQLGHHYGYSTLLLGFMLRAMGVTSTGLASIDISADATRVTRRWVDRAGLRPQVELIVGDSADPASLRAAERALGGLPGLILLDSSHQYAHTLRELDLWVPRMAPGSLLLAHDTSTFATTFDGTGEGGVQRALDEWLPGHPEAAFVSLNRQVAPGDPGTGLAYKDGCGLGILQRLAT